MTYNSSIPRRRFLQSTAISTVPVTAADRLDRDNESDSASEPEAVSDTDLIEEYLGVTTFSYPDPEGELWYRTVLNDPEEFEDCTHLIAQNIIAKDERIASDGNLHKPTIAEARFELQLTSSDTDSLPTFYREFESYLNKINEQEEYEEENSITTADFSLQSYPGLMMQYEESAPLFDGIENVTAVSYVQTFPWGLLYWDVAYDTAASVDIQLDAHRQFLKKRIQRDWDGPTLATKSHWQEVHDGTQSGKVRYHGDISSILATATGFEEMPMERADGELGSTSSTTDSIAVDLSAH